MFLFILTTLLQTFCYGAQTPREEGSCSEISRVWEHPFVYSYCEQLHKKLTQKGMVYSTIPQESDMGGLLHWLHNTLTLPNIEEYSQEVVDDELRKALKISSFENFFSKEKKFKSVRKRRKVFIVPGCRMNSLLAIARDCESAELYVFASQKRFLTPKDFDFKPYVAHLHQLHEQHKKKPKTELSGATYLIGCVEKRYQVKLSVISTPHDSEDPDQLEKTMIFIKDFLAQKEAVDFDGMVASYPFALAKQKMANHVLTGFTPVVDVETTEDTSSSTILEALHYTLITKPCTMMSLTERKGSETTV